MDKLCDWTNEQTDKWSRFHNLSTQSATCTQAPYSRFFNHFYECFGSGRFRAAYANSASALPLPLPLKRSYFISSYPTHLFGSGWQKQPLPLPLPKHWVLAFVFLSTSLLVCSCNPFRSIYHEFWVKSHQWASYALIQTISNRINHRSTPTFDDQHENNHVIRNMWDWSH